MNTAFREEWRAIALELSRVEEEYRRARIRPGGAPALLSAEYEQLIERLRRVIAIYLDGPAELREDIRSFFRQTDRVARMVGHVAGRAHQSSNSSRLIAQPCTHPHPDP